MEKSKNKKESFINSPKFYLIIISVLLFFSLAVNVYSSSKIREVAGDNLRNVSKAVNGLNGELQGIREKISSLTKSIEELEKVEKELKGIKDKLAEVAEIKDKLSNLGTQLREIEQAIKNINIWRPWR